MNEEACVVANHLSGHASTQNDFPRRLRAVFRRFLLLVCNGMDLNIFGASHDQLKHNRGCQLVMSLPPALCCLKDMYRVP